MKKIFFITMVISVFYSCKTDFEINAPYQKLPIVYGLLDQSVDTQYIKINRTYLGTSNLDYTRINDSTHFKNVTAKVEQWTNGVLGNVYTLQSKSFPVLPSDGIFYTDSQTVYYFVEPSLSENSTYKLSGTGDGISFSGETNLIKNFDFVLRFKNYAKKLSGVSLAADGAFNEVKPEWKTAAEGRRYDASMRFNYTEFKNGTATPMSIDYKIGTRKASSLNGGETMLIKFSAESFFSYIGNQAKLKDTSGVTKRRVDKMEFNVTSANDIFNTYMEVNEPISSIASERPEFTNIEGGYGIFASRYVVSIKDVKLAEKTIEELFQGSLTTDLKFCSDDAGYTGEAYYCP